MDLLSHDLILLHGKSGTVIKGDVLEMEEMSASSHKVFAHASIIITTSRGSTGYNGKNETRSLQLKQGESGGIDGVG
jgi:hypothetical protein